MSIVSIATKIISAVQLVNKIHEVVSKSTTSVPNAELSEKHRSMECTIKNGTQFTIVLKDTYLDTGRYSTPPGDIPPFEQRTFSICNRDNEWTGATGGNTFSIMVDSQAPYTFSLGWTCPEFGAYSAGVTESSVAKDGYKAATSTGNSIVSKTEYQGKHEDGEEVKFKFCISAAPGGHGVFVVNQVISN